MPVQINPVTPADEPAWRELWRQYLEFYEAERPDALYRRNFAALVAGNGPIYGFVARDADGQLVGLTHFLFHATAWSQAETCYLQDLYVLPEQRGGGVAAALIEAVASAARERGCERLYWMTHQDNARARVLYDRVARFEGFLCYEQALVLK